ncbi:MAG: hypothetical protein LAT67_14840 [Balneolales bacterium]|nr:hypothetical protein [Balneolales bacterium]
MYLVIFLVAACNTTDSYENPDTIFGYWKLDRIVYESGEILRPGDGDTSPIEPEEELHWLGFLDEEVEGEYHKKLTGGSYCNNVSGSFTEKPGAGVEVKLVCTRAGCGISPEFCYAVGTSHSYEFRKGNLHLFFDFQRENQRINGMVILEPFSLPNVNSR